MICKKCGQQFEDSFNNCPNCGENVNGKKKDKKPIFKKWWFWIIVAVVLIGFISIISGGGEETGFGGNKTEMNTDSANIVENVAEYEINRVFVTSKLEALIDGYSNYEAGEGNKFVVVDADVKNLMAEPADIAELIKGSIEIGGINYNSENYLVTENSIDNLFIYIDPLSNGRIYFAFRVPADANTDNILLTMTCGKNISSCTVSVSEYEAKQAKIVFGKEYTDNTSMNVVFEEVFFTTRLNPPRIDGVYSYYEADSGKTYLVAKLKAKNLKGFNLNIEDVTSVKCIFNGKYNYNGFVCAEEDDGSDLDSYGSIQPLETKTLYYLIQVPAEVENGPAKLEVYLLGEIYTLDVK